jgi:predicted enzyme related to lactoylglutathione lyase
MSRTDVKVETSPGSPNSTAVDMNIEALVVPVSDVDRAKRFYGTLGWRLDADVSAGDLRLIQFTPPGSGC